jgi:hypothetical protein
MSKGGGGGANYYPMPTIQASNSSGNTSSSTTIPQWLTDASQFGVQNAQNIIKQGTPQYNGPLAVGMTGNQTAAGDMIKNSVGAYQPYYDNAQDAINNSMTRLQPQTLANGLSGISQYMNPYISNVVNSVSDISRDNLAKSLNQTADQALAARAFGGSRHAIQEGIATAQNNQNTNNLIANLLSSGYNQATNMLGTDVQAQNQAAQQNNANALAGGQALSNLGTANRAANTADINNLLTYGGLEQQTGQNAADKLYNYWQYQNQYPLQAQQVYNQTVSSAPHNVSQTGSQNSNTTSLGWTPQQQATSNPLMGGLGGALAGAQLGSMVPGLGTGLGAIGGGLLGLLR